MSRSGRSTTPAAAFPERPCNVPFPDSKDRRLPSSDDVQDPRDSAIGGGDSAIDRNVERPTPNAESVKARRRSCQLLVYCFSSILRTWPSDLPTFSTVWTTASL